MVRKKDYVLFYIIDFRKLLLFFLQYSIFNLFFHLFFVMNRLFDSANELNKSQNCNMDEENELDFLL